MKQFDKDVFKVWNWKHPVMLHWVINPGVAVTEFMGVVIPRVMLIKRDKSKSLVERTFIPCPHCDTIHSSLKWSKQNNTHNKNWYGYHCDHCLETIPPLRNWLSGLVFRVIKPFNQINRQRWKKAQPDRFLNLKMTFEEEKVTIKKGFLISLIFGGFMFAFMTSFNWLLGVTIDSKFLLVNLIVWTIAGLLFGFILRAFANKQVEKSLKYSNKAQLKDF